MKTYKARMDGKAIICQCGGQVSPDAQIKRRLPLGFGFMPGDARFSMAYRQERKPSAYQGYCYGSKHEGERYGEYHIEQSGSIASRYGKARIKYQKTINRRLASVGVA